MKSFKDHINEAKKIKWNKVKADYSYGPNKYKYVSSDGKLEIQYTGYDTTQKTRDGRQKALPTVIDLSDRTPRKPNKSYKTIAAAKKAAQKWVDTFWNEK